MPEKSFQNAVQRSLIQVASAPQCSRKLWTKPNSGNSVPCILPCKIGGSWNLMKEWYLSKTPFLTFVYLSKCDTKLRGIFGNAKKSFSLTGLMIIDQKSLESEKLSLQQTLCWFIKLILWAGFLWRRNAGAIGPRRPLVTTIIFWLLLWIFI